MQQITWSFYKIDFMSSFAVYIQWYDVVYAYNDTVLRQLSDPIGTKTYSDNQKVWIIKQKYMK